MTCLMRSLGPGDHLRLKVERAGRESLIDIEAGLSDCGLIFRSNRAATSPIDSSIRPQMQRPILSTSLSEAEFERWYWLKAELQAFCRAQGVSAAGPKLELSARIAALLSSRPHHPPRPKPSRSAAMPSSFTPETVIGHGWRCSQDLRRFFESHFGKSFAFNEPLRNFVKVGVGQTLAEALALYEQSLVAGPRQIAPQFEYNNHMRDYRSTHPSSTHADAVSAWWARRGKPIR